MSTLPGRRVKYLNNRDLLAEIHKSKCSFCSFVDPSYKMYDVIVTSLSQVNQETVDQAKQVRAKRLGTEQFIKERLSGNKKIKLADCVVDISEISDQDIVIRLMTFEHIPVNLTRKKTNKSTADGHDKVNFPPFQHWKFNEDNQLICVGKSHWIGGIENGHFSKDHGRISENLGKMFMKLSEKYAQRSNWRGYTYIDEMKGQAVLQLSQIGLQFDESKSENPFAYYTAAVTNSFTRILNIEKRSQNIRDDILEENGLSPSSTRQSKEEFSAESARQAEIYKNTKMQKSADDPEIEDV